MKKFGALFAALAFVGSAFALEQHMPPGAKYSLEQSQAQVQQQQAHTGRYGQVGTVPVSPRDNQGNTLDPNQHSAEQTLALSKEREQSRANLQVAEKRAKTQGKKSGGFSWVSILFILGGFAVVFGAKKWAEKSLPDMPATRKPRA